MSYHRPHDLDEALALLAAQPWTILAGGTDLYPATRAPELPGDVLDINALGSLRGIVETGQGWRLGARTTWSDVIGADLPPAFDALKRAAQEVGAIQIQNSGTIAGNLCNASPAADGIPALLILDAEVELCSAAGTRTLALAEFVTGARTTARRPNELLTAILIPRASTNGAADFRKLGARKYLVISIAMVAARIEVRAGNVSAAALAVGACSAVARRLPEIEVALIGKPVDAMLAGAVSDESVASRLAPIDDVRSSADYRRLAAAELLRRAITGAAGRAR